MSVNKQLERAGLRWLSSRYAALPILLTAKHSTVYTMSVCMSNTGIVQKC